MTRAAGIVINLIISTIVWGEWLRGCSAVGGGLALVAIVILNL